MEDFGNIEIRISGTNGNVELSPDNYDIKDIITMLENAENLLFPNDKQNRPTISYNLQAGSVRHIFTIPLQFIIGFNAIIGQVNKTQDIDFMLSKTALAIEQMQTMAQKKNYVFEISTSLENTNKLEVTPQTKYFRKNVVWADAEFYFYGKITDAGGKDKANIHLLTEEYGTIRVQTSIDFLEQYEKNILYKKMGIYAVGKQNVKSGEIDMSTLKFLELVDYQPKYDADYLNRLREKAQKSWLGNINTDFWINEIRGGYNG
ncbi:MAG: hypothetical protein LBV75_08055 [Paludibacter sp.]|nr:hypothetical protein [Paludibacter sp.]